MFRGEKIKMDKSRPQPKPNLNPPEISPKNWKTILFMSELNPLGFKKRNKASSKVDRRLSPLNPAAVQRDGLSLGLGLGDADSGVTSLNSLSVPSNPPVATLPTGSLSAEVLGMNGAISNQSGYQTGTQSGYLSNLSYTPNSFQTESDSDQSSQGPIIRKQTFGLVLRKLAASEGNGSFLIGNGPFTGEKDSINYASDSDAVLAKKLPSNGSFRREFGAINGISEYGAVQEKKFINRKPVFLTDTRSIMLFRSASMVELPKWSVSSNRDEIVVSSADSSNSPSTLSNSIAPVSPLGKGFEFLPRLNSLFYIDSNYRKKKISKHYIKIIEDSPKTIVEKLERFASTLSSSDVQLYTSIVEHSRRSKNFLWLHDPIAVWPDWHEGLLSISPMSPFQDSFTVFGTSSVRLPPRCRSVAPSPVLSPLPISSRDSNSLSPGYCLEYNIADSESDSARVASKPKTGRGLSIITHRKQQSDITTPEKNEVSAASTRISTGHPKMTRSHSDGDLTEYLKGFTDLKGSLELAQHTCNNEIRKILEELQEHVEKSLETEREKNDSKSLNDSISTDDDSSFSSLSSSRINSVLNNSSARLSTQRGRAQTSSTGSLSIIAPKSRKLTLSSSTRSSDGLSKVAKKMTSSSLSNPSISGEANRVASTSSLSTPRGTTSRTKPLMNFFYDNSNASDTSDDDSERKKTINSNRVSSTEKIHRKMKSDSLKLAADLNLNSAKKSNEFLITTLDTHNPFMEAISSIISIAQSILDLDLNSLMNPQTTQQYISDILKLQMIWTQNPSWQLQELVVRLLIVFASVARLAEHFEEDFRSWNHLATNSLVATREKRLKNLKNRRDSQTSSKIDSPLSLLKSAASFSYGAESSDGGDYDSDDYYSLFGSPKRQTSKKNASDNFYHRESLKAFKEAVDEDQSMNVLMELNASGKVTYISPAVQKVFQYSQLDILGSNSLLFLLGTDNESNPFRISAANCVKERPNLEICIDTRRADGMPIKVECHGLVAFDSMGVIQSVVWLIRPVKLGRGDDSPSLLTSEFMSRISETEIIPNVDMALCNICDKSVPAIYFSIHTNACLKVHKTEMDLMLLNDEIKTLRKAFDEKLEVLKLEIYALKNDISHCGSDIQDDQLEKFSKNKLLVEFYEHIYLIGNDTLKSLEQLLTIKIPKQELLGILFDNIFESIEKNPVSDKVFMFSGDTYEFGMEILQLLKSFHTFFDQKRTQTNILIEELLDYLECLDAEHLLTIEIGLQTAAISDPKFEMKEIGGVLVNVPSLDSNNIGKGSVFFQSSPQPSSPLGLTNDLNIQQDSNLQQDFKYHQNLKNLNPSDASKTDSEATLVKRKMIKPSDLRIQTDQEPVEGNVLSRSPSRNTRMVVEDRSIEVDFDTILTPTRSSYRNSILSPTLSITQSSIYSNTPHISTASKSAFTQPSRSLSFSHSNSVQNPPRSNPLQTQIIRTANGGRQLSLNPCGSSSNLTLPRTFSVSSGLSPSSSVSQPSIKDYEIIKPISKGAFGSVFLAKKKISSQYFAIKVLRKADMVAKNQASNIKSERTILTQLDSPYVVKLFSTFQSKNHIYLVMEYLNGGDCAALLKSMGQLDEDWAKQYITEMVEGLSFLHKRDIVHRDLKPDNMLIDITGHIKLTDFGLSKAGFLGRRALGVGDVGSLSRQSVLSRNFELGSTSVIPPSLASLKSSRRDSSSSQISFDSLLSKDNEKTKKTAVGTPDYLAPESILGLGQGVSVDWWACGVILYEFLYGIPPFNAATPHLVFENILIHRIDWLEEELHISIEARELMENLMCHDMEKRIGTKSSEEVKNMAWFQGTDWDHLSNQKVFFSPTVKNIEDTDYFDARGVQNPDGLSDSDESVDNGTGTEASIPEDDDGTDFGGAVMKNLPLLEKANQKTMNKINQEFPEGEAWMQKRRDSLPLMTLPFGSNPHSPSLSSPIGGPLRSVSPLHLQSMTRRDSLPLNPAGPASPTKLSPKKVNRLLASASLETMWQKPLDYSTVNNAPSLNTINNIMSQGSLSLIKDEDDFMSRKRSQAYLDIAKQNLINQTTLETPITSPFQSIANAVKSSSDHALNLTSHETSFSPPFLDVLIAESNPAAALVLENILQTAGCRCVQVKSGAEVIQCAMGEIKFGIIFCDINLPVMNGDAAARMIKSTSNINSKTPIVLLTAVPIKELDPGIFSEFNYIITKPVSHANVTNALRITLALPFA